MIFHLLLICTAQCGCLNGVHLQENLWRKSSFFFLFTDSRGKPRLDGQPAKLLQKHLRDATVRLGVCVLVYAWHHMTAALEKLCVSYPRRLNAVPFDLKPLFTQQRLQSGVMSPPARD